MSFIVNIYTDNMSVRNTTDVEGTVKPDAMAYLLEMTIQEHDRMSFATKQAAEDYIFSVSKRLHDIANELQQKAYVREIP